MNVVEVLKRIKRHEGLKLTAYPDVDGTVAIGYGRNVSRRGISQGEAEGMLIRDVHDAEDAAVAVVPRWAEQDSDVQDVCVEVAFQCGGRGLANFKRMLAALAAFDRVTAAHELLDSAVARQCPARYAELASLMRG